VTERPDSSDQQEGEATDDRLRFCDLQADNARPAADRNFGKESEKGTMQPYEELSLLIESVEDDIARAIRSGNVTTARQFAQELRARFTIYRDACADAGIAWAIRSQRTERRS
jgi:hypothetical protein